MKKCFNPSTHRFRCCGIEMIGNTNSGIVIGLDESTAKYVDSFIKGDTGNQMPPHGETLEEEFSQSGFFSDNSSPPICTAYFHVTSRCNLRCIGCYSYEEERNKKVDLTTEQCFYILDNLKSAGVQTLVISGGEPFLRADIKDILYYAKNSCNIPAILVVSNGMVDRIKYDSALPFIDLLSISVDGYDEHTHFLRNSDMKYVLDTVKYLHSRTRKLRMIFTLNAKNLGDIKEYYELSDYLKVPCSFSLLTVPNEEVYKEFFLSEASYDALSKLAEKHVIPIDDSPYSDCLGCKESCGIAQRIISISSNGDIFPCHMLHEEKLKMGNALSDTIAPDLSRNLSNKWTIFELNECKNCEFRLLCGGGCFARRYFNNPEIADSHDPACYMYKTEIRKMIMELTS